MKTPILKICPGVLPSDEHLCILIGPKSQMAEIQPILILEKSLGIIGFAFLRVVYNFAQDKPG